MDKVQLCEELQIWAYHYNRQHSLGIGWATISPTGKVCEQLQVGIVPDRVVQSGLEKDHEMLTKYNKLLRLIKHQHAEAIKLEFTNHELKQAEKAALRGWTRSYFKRLLCEAKQELLNLI